MSTLTIGLIIAFVVLLQFAPIHVVLLLESEDEDGEIMPEFHFLRVHLIHAVLLVIIHGFHCVKIISGKTFCEAFQFAEELSEN